MEALDRNGAGFDGGELLITTMANVGRGSAGRAHVAHGSAVVATRRRGKPSQQRGYLWSSFNNFDKIQSSRKYTSF
ncbi:MAG TPA: hypothetical protein VKN18_25965 [Blastocatellia bacterium]|nr:hypothetical protein [Blastocatellia bacterium]